MQFSSLFLYQKGRYYCNIASVSHIFGYFCPISSRKRGNKKFHSTQTAPLLRTIWATNIFCHPLLLLALTYSTICTFSEKWTVNSTWNEPVYHCQCSKSKTKFKEKIGKEKASNDNENFVFYVQQWYEQWELSGTKKKYCYSSAVCWLFST